MNNYSKSHHNSISSHLDQINGLPLFSGLGSDTISSLLQNSCINHFKKGQFLFMEGDEIVNFYVLLEGWIKLFKNNSEGKELIIEISHPKQSLTPDFTLFNSTFCNNAQIIAHSKVLIIPKKTLTAQIKNNWNLAQNLMDNIAHHSMELENHLSDLTLKNVPERICWFLYNLFRETNQNLNSIKLPYDKALIASYLGMKPETFSRGLNYLKEQNLIRVEKNLITILRPLEFYEEYTNYF